MRCRNSGKALLQFAGLVGRMVRAVAIAHATTFAQHLLELGVRKLKGLALPRCKMVASMPGISGAEAVVRLGLDRFQSMSSEKKL